MYFFSKLYEIWGIAYYRPFNKPLYDNKLYLSFGEWMISISFVMVITYYFIVKHNKWIRKRHWFYYLVVNFIINFIIGYIMPKNAFISLGLTQIIPNLNNHLFNFAFINAGWSIVAFFILSFIRKINVSFMSTPGVNTPF